MIFFGSSWEKLARTRDNLLLAPRIIPLRYKPRDISVVNWIVGNVSKLWHGQKEETTENYFSLRSTRAYTVFFLNRPARKDFYASTRPINLPVISPLDRASPLPRFHRIRCVVIFLPLGWKIHGSRRTRHVAVFESFRTTFFPLAFPTFASLIYQIFHFPLLCFHSF